MVVYRLAQTVEDYLDALELCRAEGVDIEQSEMEFPTILAYEEEECVGLMSCHIQDDMIISGPLLLRGDVRRPITALRLCEAFERQLKVAGVESYIIHVSKDSILTEAIPRYTPDMKPYADDGESLFYVRKIGRFQDGRPEG